MNKRYMVDLTRDERAQLLDLLNKGVAPARKLTRARILLLADESNTDETIAAALHVHRATVERTRRRFVEGGIAPALSEKPRPGGRPKLDGKRAAFLGALACSQAPEGHGRWTMQLLADRSVALEVVDAISDETVRRALKKMSRNPGKRSGGVSPSSGPLSSGAWRTCSTSMPNPMIRSARWSVSMNSPDS